MKGEIKTETEHQIIQTIIGLGLEREELRDEIYVQCMRQATNNPSIDSTERIWLLLCLTIVSFQPSKLLHKVSVKGARCVDSFGFATFRFQGFEIKCEVFKIIMRNFIKIKA